MADVRVDYAVGKPGKMVAARILPGSDLLVSLEEICKENDIKYGAVQCFGSLSSASFMYLVPMEAKMNAGYGAPVTEDFPIEFLNGVGIITQTDKGETELHFHATMCDKDGRVFGGHMLREKCPALTTIDVIITECLDVEMIRKYDEETELTQVFIEPM